MDLREVYQWLHALLHDDPHAATKLTKPEYSNGENVHGAELTLEGRAQITPNTQIGRFCPAWPPQTPSMSVYKKIPYGLAAVVGLLPRRTHKTARAKRCFTQISSRTFFDNTLAAILKWSGVPRARDSAKWIACLALTFGGSGGSLGLTSASITTGPRMSQRSGHHLSAVLGARQ